MLEAKSCVPCQRGAPPLTAAEANNLNKETPDWEVFDGHTKIQRKYTFSNFVEAMEFSQKVGGLCEAEGHHADITFGWGYCNVLFYTHKIKGLHENDFIMAAKTDSLYSATS